MILAEKQEKYQYYLQHYHKKIDKYEYFKG